MRRISPANAFAYTLFFLSGIVLLGIFYFLSTITVIKDWTLTLPTQDIHVGDTVVIESTYNKVRPAAGESIRYIECQNHDHVWIRYELNRATANRQAGKGGTGIVIVVRRDVADVPTQCKFTVIIRYDVLPFRSVYQSQSTKEFTLLTERTNGNSEVESSVTTQNSQSRVSPSSGSQSGSSFNYSTTNNYAAPSESSQPQEQQQTNSDAGTPVNKPSLVQQITNTIRGIL